MCVGLRGHPCAKIQSIKGPFTPSERDQTDRKLLSVTLGLSMQYILKHSKVLVHPKWRHISHPVDNWQPTMLKFHKESDFHLPQSQNCLLGMDLVMHDTSYTYISSIHFYVKFGGANLEIISEFMSKAISEVPLQTSFQKSLWTSSLKSLLNLHSLKFLLILQGKIGYFSI